MLLQLLLILLLLMKGLPLVQLATLLLLLLLGWPGCVSFLGSCAWLVASFSLYVFRLL